MKKLKFLVLLLLLLFKFTLINPFSLQAKDVNIGLSVNNGKITHFYFAIGDYYRIPTERIIIIKKRYPIIIEEELPIIFLITKERRIAPDIIIKLREKGYSWYEIMIYFGLHPEIIFKPIIVTPPYGKAWGYYKYHPKKGKIIFLTDRDIIELSNIKFLTEYYHIDPKIVMNYKTKYPNFVEINEKLFNKHRR